MASVPASLNSHYGVDVPSAQQAGQAVFSAAGLAWRSTAPGGPALEVLFSAVEAKQQSKAKPLLRLKTTLGHLVFAFATMEEQERFIHHLSGAAAPPAAALSPGSLARRSAKVEKSWPLATRSA